MGRTSESRGRSRSGRGGGRRRGRGRGRGGGRGRGNRGAKFSSSGSRYESDLSSEQLISSLGFDALSSNFTSRQVSSLAHGATSSIYDVPDDDGEQERLFTVLDKAFAADDLKLQQLEARTFKSSQRLTDKNKSKMTSATAPRNSSSSVTPALSELSRIDRRHKKNGVTRKMFDEHTLLRLYDFFVPAGLLSDIRIQTPEVNKSSVSSTASSSSSSLGRAYSADSVSQAPPLPLGASASASARVWRNDVEDDIMERRAANKAKKTAEKQKKKEEKLAKKEKKKEQRKERREQRKAERQTQKERTQEEDDNDDVDENENPESSQQQEPDEQEEEVEEVSAPYLFFSHHHHGLGYHSKKYEYTSMPSSALRSPAVSSLASTKIPEQLALTPDLLLLSLQVLPSSGIAVTITPAADNPSATAQQNDSNSVNAGRERDTYDRKETKTEPESSTSRSDRPSVPLATPPTDDEYDYEDIQELDEENIPKRGSADSQSPELLSTLLNKSDSNVSEISEMDAAHSSTEDSFTSSGSEDDENLFVVDDLDDDQHNIVLYDEEQEADKQNVSNTEEGKQDQLTVDSDHWHWSSGNQVDDAIDDSQPTAVQLIPESPKDDESEQLEDLGENDENVGDDEKDLLLDEAAEDDDLVDDMRRKESEEFDDLVKDLQTAFQPFNPETKNQKKGMTITEKQLADDIAAADSDDDASDGEGGGGAFLSDSGFTDCLCDPAILSFDIRNIYRQLRHFVRSSDGSASMDFPAITDAFHRSQFECLCQTYNLTWKYRQGKEGTTKVKKNELQADIASHVISDLLQQLRKKNRKYVVKMANACECDIHGDAAHTRAARSARRKAHKARAFLKREGEFVQDMDSILSNSPTQLRHLSSPSSSSSSKNKSSKVRRSTTVNSAARPDIPLSNSNLGYRMLLSIGWKEGEALGSSQSSSGLLQPIAASLKMNSKGLGFQPEDRAEQKRKDKHAGKRSGKRIAETKR